MISNKSSDEITFNQSEQVCFINYDFKNCLETFHSKNNNPLEFPTVLCIDVISKTISDNLNSLNITTNTPNHLITIHPTISKVDYIKQINTIKQHIQQGDIYEINYCITFEAHNVSINPIELYNKLDSISNAPYSTLLNFNELVIISSSPELYIKKENSTLTSKPIKGTAKRGQSSIEDALLKESLHQNLKERTENVMIVDVVRNDFSKIADKGSVVVEKLFDIESYQQVHQMVSTVSCQLKPNTSLSEIIVATFPMASMTGAPKIRAMELSDDYEIYNRGPYSGCLGIIDDNDFELSVLIRSIFYNKTKKYLSFSVGSAITAMCNAEDEYEECLLKAKAMMQVLTK